MRAAFCLKAWSAVGAISGEYIYIDIYIHISSSRRGNWLTDWSIAGATKLCTVKNHLSSIPNSQLTIKKKRHGFCGLSVTKSYECSFITRVIVSAADLRFELWFKDHKLSAEHDVIQVTWDPVGEKISGWWLTRFWDLIIQASVYYIWEFHFNIHGCICRQGY